MKFNKNKKISNLLKTLGITFLSFNNSPISFPNLEFINLFENVDGFIILMSSHFKETIKINIAKILGNLDIIGSPVFFFS